MNKKAEIEQLKEQEDVKTALKQTAGSKEVVPKPVARLRDKLWFSTYILILLVLLTVYYLLGSALFPTQTKYISLLRQLSVGAISVVMILGIAKSIQVYWIGQIENRPARYN